MSAAAPFLAGMLLAQGASLWGLHRSDDVSPALLAAAFGLLAASLVAGTALAGQYARQVDRIADAAAALVLVVAAGFFFRERAPWVLGTALVVLLAVLNLRLRTRRDTLFSLLCGLGLVVYASVDLWRGGSAYFVIPYACGGALALAARYYADQAGTEARPPLRFTAPGVLVYGLLPALVVAAPLIFFLPELPPRALPFQIPEGGIVVAQGASSDTGPPEKGKDKGKGKAEPSKDEGRKGGAMRLGGAVLQEVEGGSSPQAEGEAVTVRPLGSLGGGGGGGDCALDVLSPAQHPAFYPLDKDPARDSSVVLRVRSPGPVYLREQVFDRYEDGRWTCASRGTRDVAAMGLHRFFIDDARTREPWGLFISAEKPVEGAMLPLLMRPEFLRVALPVLRVNADHAVGLPSTMLEGSRYYAESAVGKWPSWRPVADLDRREVAPEHLEVPPSIRESVEAAALRAVGGHWNVLARAEALERYLRREYRHSLEVLRRERSGVDPVQQFLDDSRVGHAELFASAMVLAARSLDIPARLVTGHVAVRKEFDGQGYVAHRLDAHAWAELRIEGRWTTYDPAPFRTVPTLRPSGSRFGTHLHYLRSLDALAAAHEEVVPGANHSGNVWEAQSTSRERWLVRLWRGVRTIGTQWHWLALLAAAGAAGIWLRRRLLRGPAWSGGTETDPRARMLAAYAAVEREAAHGGLRRHPAEHHHAFLRALGVALPPAAAPARTLGAEFARARYGLEPVTARSCDRAVAATRAILDAIAEARRLGRATFERRRQSV
jgi:transglutaminase-like putative cysteine protease